MEKKKWICCSCCGETIFCGTNNTTCREVWSTALTCGFDGGCSTLDCILFPIFCIFLYLFYILFFVWIDIINYCCNCKKKYYFVGIPYTFNYEGLNIDYFDEMDKNMIWNFAFSEDKWKNRKSWKCHNCKYSSPNFTDFILTNKDLNKTNENIYLKKEDLNLDGIMMSVLFNSVDGKINYSIHLQKGRYIFRN